MPSKLPLLRRLENLYRLGFHVPFEQGSTIARGFADLGYEEFVVVRTDRIVSLFTGHGSELSEDAQAHFFTVLSSEEMEQHILQRGYDIVEAKFVSQREWQLVLVPSEGDRKIVVHAPTIREALLEGLIEICQIDQSSRSQAQHE